MMNDRRNLFRRRGAGLALGGLALVALGGCVAPVVERPVRERVVVEHVPAGPAVRAMPGPIREDRGAQPGPDFHWVPGHWAWQGNDWAWQHGHWVRQPVPPMPPVIVEQMPPPPAPHNFWVPGHWRWRADVGNWLWVRGSWH